MQALSAFEVSEIIMRKMIRKALKSKKFQKNKLEKTLRHKARKCYKSNTIKADFANIKPSRLFNDNFDNPSHTYCRVRDGKNDSEVKARALAEKYWLTFQHFVEPNFLEQFTKDFNARFWEMDLAVNLWKNGFKLKKQNDPFGPDVCLESAPKVWVEAIAVKSGTKADKVPERTFDKHTQQPPFDRQTILRYTSAIKTKFTDIYDSYFSSGLIADDEPYIIAINGSQLPNVRQDSEIPRVVRSVFAIGNEVLKFNKTDKSLRNSFDFSSSVTKVSGQEIPTDIFLNKEYCRISALIFSYADCSNRPKKKTDWIVVHNPHAINPIKHCSLPCAQEYWVTLSDNQFTLHCRTST